MKETMNQHLFPFSVIVIVPEDPAAAVPLIRSLENQGIGFQDNIQLILIDLNEGDHQDDTFKSIRQTYPSNTKYINKPGENMESARNIGIAAAEGELLVFPDADAVWNRGAFQAVYNYHHKHPEISVISSRLVYSQKSDGYHPQDFRFKKTGMVRIDQDPLSAEIYLERVFISSELLHNYRFEEHAVYDTDIILLSRLILQEQQYGLVKEARYSIAKSKTKVSVAYETSTPSARLKQAEATCDELIHLCMQDDIPSYIQNILLLETKYLINKPLPENFEQGEIDDHLSRLRTILGYADDSMILQHRNLDYLHTLYLLCFKHQVQDLTTLPDAAASMLKKSITDIGILEADLKHNALYLFGRSFERYLGEEYSVYIESETGERFPFQYHQNHVYDKKGADPSIVLHGFVGEVSLPLRKGARYTFYKAGRNNAMKCSSPSYGEFSRLTRFSGSFFTTKNHIVKNTGGAIEIEPYSLRREMSLEKVYQDVLINESCPEDILKLRKTVRRNTHLRQKPIWIITDRSDVAGDNGEALFCYLMKNKFGKKYRIYFLLEKNSPDYERLCSIGKVLEMGSQEHMLKHLMASKVISSAGENWVFTPVRGYSEFLRDLYHADFVFLQHGITKDDLSSWLKKRSKNIRMLVTSSKGEYDSILRHDYDYDEDVVKLTGLARFDNLIDDKQNVIAILPTWRAKLAPSLIEGSSRRTYDKDFKNSEYCLFYNKLINDPQIHEAMKTAGYKGVFYLHPSHSAQQRDFVGNETISVCDGPTPFNRVFKESALLITDYSSVAMDFAYLKKPVIYTQFDISNFYQGHSYDKGYFDYEQDGFGPVCYDYSSAVNTIIQAIQNDCMMDPMYQQRVDDFFAYTDRRNCERIVREIENI